MATLWNACPQFVCGWMIQGNWVPSTPQSPSTTRCGSCLARTLVQLVYGTVSVRLGHICLQMDGWLGAKVLHSIIHLCHGTTLAGPTLHRGVKSLRSAHPPLPLAGWWVAHRRDGRGVPHVRAAAPAEGPDRAGGPGPGGQAHHAVRVRPQHGQQHW